MQDFITIFTLLRLEYTSISCTDTKSIKHFCAFLPEAKKKLQKIKRIVQLNITYSQRAQVVFPKHIFIHKNRNVLPDKIVDFFSQFCKQKKKVAQVTICEMLE